MKEAKNLKFTNKLESLAPKFKWLLFTELQDLKLTSKYIDFICPDPKKKNADSIEKLENMVKESIIREFSPDIQNSKSYDLLVDSVMYRIQKKALEKE